MSSFVCVCVCVCVCQSVSKLVVLCNVDAGEDSVEVGNITGEEKRSRLLQALSYYKWGNIFTCTICDECMSSTTVSSSFQWLLLLFFFFCNQL